MVQFAYDATQHEPEVGYKALDAGWYTVSVTKTELVPTKKEGGLMLVCSYTVLDGPALGKSITNRFNVKNNNKQAEDISARELSALCHCIGVYRMEETTQLHGIPFQVQVNKTEGEKGENNDVTGYLDAAGNPPSRAQPAAVGAAPVLAGGVGVVPNAPVAAQPAFGAGGVAPVAAVAQPLVAPPLPVAAQPVATQPIPAQIVPGQVAQPVAGQPGVFPVEATPQPAAQPAAFQPVAAQPVAAQPVVAQPAAFPAGAATAPAAHPAGTVAGQPATAWVQPAAGAPAAAAPAQAPPAWS